MIEDASAKAFEYSVLVGFLFVALAAVSIAFVRERLYNMKLSERNIATSENVIQLIARMEVKLDVDQRERESSKQKMDKIHSSIETLMERKE